jgi:putative DNA primase/helicase
MRAQRERQERVLKAARDYIRAGYRPVPIPAGEKAPNLREWTKLRVSEDDVDQYFTEPGNIGLLLGKPSGELTDVDIDAPEAAAVADVFLPPTEMVHGRKSKRRSHFWYRVENAPAPIKFTDADGACLLEIRSTGQQTLVPPSIHPKGERIRWEEGGPPAKVQAAELVRTAKLVAASALLARNWPDQGSRNETALALAGMLQRAGWSLEATETLIKTTARAAGDEQWKERAAAARSTKERLAGKAEATGATRLAELVGEPVVDKVRGWLDVPEGTFTGSEGENLTDVGNARRLVAQHGEKIRYCYTTRRWYVWTGRRWKQDLTGAIERLAKKTVRGIYGQAAQELDDAQRKRLGAWAKTSESRGRITAMIDLAKSERGVPIEPEDLDSDPWVLNFKNGTLDLRTGELRKHDPADLCTKIIPFDFNPDAACPLFRRFLRRIFDNNAALIGFVRRAFGYCLTGSTREQVIFVFWGSGANGKSTLLETIRAGLGDYACTADSSLLMAKTHDAVRNDVARLAGIRLVSTGETEAGRYLAEGFVKSLTGGDRVTARFLYSEFFEYDAQFKLILATNHKPVIRGTDNAIWRRIRLVPFKVTIPEGEQDKSLPQKLRRELPGILAWAVRGCLKWREDGLGQPDEVMAATQAYREEMDVIGGFLKDRCVESANLRESAATLYSAYKSWCERTGERSLTQQRFGVALADRGFTPNRTRRARFWMGLKCSDAGDASDTVLQ